MKWNILVLLGLIGLGVFFLASKNRSAENPAQTEEVKTEGVVTTPEQGQEGEKAETANKVGDETILEDEGTEAPAPEEEVGEEAPSNSTNLSGADASAEKSPEASK